MLSQQKVGLGEGGRSRLRKQYAQSWRHGRGDVSKGVMYGEKTQGQGPPGGCIEMAWKHSDVAADITEKNALKTIR